MVLSNIQYSQELFYDIYIFNNYSNVDWTYGTLREKEKIYNFIYYITKNYCIIYFQISIITLKYHTMQVLDDNDIYLFFLLFYRFMFSHKIIYARSLPFWDKKDFPLTNIQILHFIKCLSNLRIQI